MEDGDRTMSGKRQRHKKEEKRGGVKGWWEQKNRAGQDGPRLSSKDGTWTETMGAADRDGALQRCCLSSSRGGEGSGGQLSQLGGLSETG